MNSKEEVIKEKVKEIRFEVLSSSLRIENTLVYSLSRLYCMPDDDGKEVFYINILENDVFLDLTFDKKIKIFKKCFKYLRINIALAGKVEKKLNKIRKIRNEIVHREYRYSQFLEITSQGNDSVNLSFEKKGKTVFSFSIEQLEGYKLLCKETEQNIYSILDEILNQREEELKTDD